MHYTIQRTNQGRLVIHEYRDVEGALRHANVTGARMMTLEEIILRLPPQDIQDATVLTGE